MLWTLRNFAAAELLIINQATRAWLKPGPKSQIRLLKRINRRVIHEGGFHLKSQSGSGKDKK
jgi:hypothetical protein